ncbi:MAG: ribbon-helix-helix protein, CopG family [Candidatus Schekmanbacteria bacterium]|nr:ribbon-helix-helix protein, CopG family [Candidatus Schekmanbacteria bacterium]
MTDMVRKQIYLDRRLERLLKERCARVGRSQAEVVREALESALGPDAESAELRAWYELKLFFDERSIMKSEETQRRWTREEAYEDGA